MSTNRRACGTGGPMKKIRRWLALAVLLAMPAMWTTNGWTVATEAPKLFGGRVSYVLFGGGNVDSNEQASNWIPVAGAQRVIIRTWSGKAAFHASTDADSTFSDSLITFTILFSDSLGVANPPAAADSFVVDPAISTADSGFVGASAYPLPINKELRGPSNGSGIVTVVYPISPRKAPGANTAVSPVNNTDVIGKAWMRVRVTPLRRMTVTGSQSTAGKRVNGLKDFRMWATVIQ